MKIEIENLDNGYLVIWEFSLFTKGQRAYKTLSEAISFAKSKLEQYKQYE